MLTMDHQPERIVAIIPNWVGDAVMFTPTLRAIQRRFDGAAISLLARPAPAAALAPCPWADEIIIDGGGLIATTRRLRRGKFDLAVLGPNSFRSALTARLGGVRRRLGYARDGRGWLLSDKLSPVRDADGDWAVTPALDYYLKLAEHLGCDVTDKRMELSVADEDGSAADRLLHDAGATHARPVVLINPGASFGPSKLYPIERFAAVADALVASRGAQVVINAAPTAEERAIARAVAAVMRRPVLINCADRDNTLGLLKALIVRADLVITNDTGPRHIAAALGTPVVTIFGATDPDWTTIDYDKERIIRVDVPCGPCRKKECLLPLGADHHQCMTKISPEMVVAAAEELLAAKETA